MAGESETIALIGTAPNQIGAQRVALYGSDGSPLDSGQSDGGTRPIQVVLVSPAGTRFDAAAGQADGTTATRALWAALSAFNGATFDRLRAQNVIKTIAAVAITAGTAATIWTPTSGKKLRLMGWSLSASAAASLIFAFGATPTVMFRTELLAAAGISQTGPGFGNGTMPGAANDALKLDVSATATVSGYVFGTEE